MLSLLAAENPVEHVLPHEIFRLFGVLPVTNQMIMAIVAGVLMLIFFIPLFSEPVPEAPTGAKNFFEAILEFLRIEVFRPALKEHTDRFVPFLWTLFFFILFSNLLGQIPIAEFFTVLTGKSSHFGGTPTGSIATTGALAVVAFFVIHVSGIGQVFRSLRDGTYGHHAHHEEHTSDGLPGHEAAHDLQHMRGEALAADVPGDFRAVHNPTKHYADGEHGTHGIPHGHARIHPHADDHAHAGTSAVAAALMAVPLYLWNFAPHPFKPGPGGNPLMWVADIFMWGVLLVLELIGAVIKPFALMVRLFANMIAGHIVLAVLVGLIPFAAGIGVSLAMGIPVTIVSVLISILELFVAFLQAYIFVFLTTLFIASAVAPEH